MVPVGNNSGFRLRHWLIEVEDNVGTSVRKGAVFKFQVNNFTDSDVIRERVLHLCIRSDLPGLCAKIIPVREADRKALH